MASRYLTLCCSLLAAWQPATCLEAGDDLYVNRIRTLLQERCYACHGALKQEAGLRLDTGQSIRQGSENGPIIDPAAPHDSELLARLLSSDESSRMPPIGKPISEEDIGHLRNWIAAGAPSPAGETPEAAPSEHWAFRAIVRPQVPEHLNTNWVMNPVDSFIRRRHVEQGLVVAQSASSAHLLRRVTLDLIGIPPTPKQLEDFLKDPSQAHYERIVDALLASPHYGERWGRHWMDVWRYSDWYGRRQQNDVRNSAPQLWKWRDWIVNSLNADRSYARMIQEMLAADEMAADDDSAWPATGYLIRSYYSLNPNEWMRHNVEYTGKAFLGLTFNCAHCHDHKYDPISHDDYFRMRAFFEPIGIRQDRVVGEAEPPPFAPYVYGGSRKVVRTGIVRIYDEQPDTPTWFYTGGDERNKLKDRGSIAPGVPEFLDVPFSDIAAVDLPMSGWYPGSRPGIQQAILDDHADAIRSARKHLEEERPSNPQSDTIQSRIARLGLEAAEQDAAQAQLVIAADNAIRNGASEHDVEQRSRAAYAAQLTAKETDARWRILNVEHQLADARALPETHKDKKQTLETLEKQLAAANTALQAILNKKMEHPESTDYERLSPVTAKQSTGRRTALAAWITHPDNPLTPRVAINHIWMRHFHAPLVESVYDFGRNGKPPSHPELLDWLADELTDHEWSMKHIHRLIVTSRTYHMSSASRDPEANSEIDVDNRWLWRMNTGRMEAEIIRDSVLSVSGRLIRTVGGEVRPNSEAMTTFRRSLYYEVYPEDGGNNPLAELFDAPDPGECFRRTRTVMPQQALALSNSEFTHAAASIVAKLVSESAGADHADFVDECFRRILCRPPTEKERIAAREFLVEQSDVFGSREDVREGFVRALLNHNDFVAIR
ncbi:MAG: PSD1 and planctomycete cytochrome C domain-containing protein [Planctomycetaceae bacterium]